MRAVAATTALLSLWLAAPATAQIQLDPNRAGAQSKLVIDAQPQGQSGGDVRAIVVSGVRGLKVDPRSRAARCSDEQARDFACPEKSRIGRGDAKGHASGALIPGGRQDFTAKIDAFLAKPRQAGDIAAVVLQFNEPQSGQRGTVTGRIVPVGGSGPFGVELRFEDLGGGSSQPQFPGVTIAIDRITLTVGAKRTVVKKKRVRRRGRRVTVRKRVRYSLLTNPRACPSNRAWPFRVTTEYGDGRPPESQDSSLPCTPR